jgi:hypothetical protein
MEKRSKILDKSGYNLNRFNPELPPSVATTAIPHSKQCRGKQYSTNNLSDHKDSLESRYLILQQMYQSLIDKIN